MIMNLPNSVVHGNKYKSYIAYTGVSWLAGFQFNINIPTMVLSSPY